MARHHPERVLKVPPSGGSLEIGKFDVVLLRQEEILPEVPPSGGSLEIGKVIYIGTNGHRVEILFPLRGDP